MDDKRKANADTPKRRTYKASIACMHIMSDNVHVEYMRFIRILNLAPSSKRSLLEKKERQENQAKHQNQDMWENFTNPKRNLNGYDDAPTGEA